jgi:hypothetical protein
MRIKTIWALALFFGFAATSTFAQNPATPTTAPQEPQRPGLPQGAGTSGRTKIVFVTGRPSHGFAQHEQYAGSMLLARLLNENMPNVEAVVYKYAWPQDPHAFDGAASVIVFTDGDRGHPVIPHRDQVNELTDKGVGIGFLHWGVEVPKGQSGDDFLKWMGGYFETNWSVNPEWTASVTPTPDIPATRGVHPFSTHDEWYFNMRFRPNMEGVTPVLSAVPPDSLRSGRDGIRSGNPAVRAGIGKNQPEALVWIATRGANDSRGFGCSGAHYHFNWAQDDFRKAILNCIVWTAHLEVPKDGVPSKTPTLDELLANQDKKMPANFNREKVQKQIEDMNHPPATTAPPPAK